MTFFIQHAWGKSDKIQRLGELLTGGVILSPADESVDALASIASEFDKQSVLLDPQLYVKTIDGGAGRLHGANDIHYEGVHWSASSADVSRHVRQVIDLNGRVGTNILCAPSPLQSGFHDIWTPLAMQYARTMVEAAPSAEVFASLVVEEAGLADWSVIEDWLDIATQLEVRGFYVVVSRRGGAYPEAWKNPLLENLLRLIHRLVAGGFRVIVGYADIEGLAAVALGAGMATGWYFSQRRFTEARWVPSTGGKASLPRFMARRLLVPLLASEATRIVRTRHADFVTTSDETRAALVGSAWGLTESRSQHLRAMAQLAKAISDGDTIGKRLDAVQRRADEAARNLETLSASGALVAVPNYQRVVSALSAGVAALRSKERI